MHNTDPGGLIQRFIFRLRVTDQIIIKIIGPDQCEMLVQKMLADADVKHVHQKRIVLILTRYSLRIDGVHGNFLPDIQLKTNLKILMSQQNRGAIDSLSLSIRLSDYLALLYLCGARLARVISIRFCS